MTQDMNGVSQLVPQAVPRLVLSDKVRKSPTLHDPATEYQFRYRAKSHAELPHVVKFSGGRSSGMLLLVLLDNNILRPDRGDVIVFNNTSAEHPSTYRFVQDCMRVSRQYGIPFFWTEYQTYEDARKGEWTRLPSYRLVNCRPRSEDNPDGFHWRGEVFQELLSYAGYVPNVFSRICTQSMKLEATRRFLSDWLAGKEAIPRLGHYGSKSRIDDDTLYKRHKKNQGEVPRSILLKKRAYSRSRPHSRPQQQYSDFCPSWSPFSNPVLDGNAYGGRAWFGKGGVEYVAFVGLRMDEGLRVSRVLARNSGPGSSGYEGEHVYMPLADMAVARDDVNHFWEKQHWDLSLPSEGSLSNCVYCFLKGVSNLQEVHGLMHAAREEEVADFGSMRDTPSDIDWWIRMEEMYGRDLQAERRKITGNPESTTIGFFGTTGLTYKRLHESNGKALPRYSQSLLPCDCTE